MDPLVVWIGKFGLPTVLGAVVIYLLLNGDITIIYRRGSGRKRG